MAPPIQATSEAGRAQRLEQADGNAEENAADLIAQATDPGTGHVDTRKLGEWVADANRRDPAAASAAYVAIEGQLARRNPADAARFDQDIVAAAAHPLPGGLWAAGQSWASNGAKLLVDNPILVKQWESTLSAWTGRGGFTAGLQNLLERSGIQIAPVVNPIPPGSVPNGAGVSDKVANNTNGRLARDAIADHWRSQGFEARIEQSRNGGARRVDIVVDLPANDRRFNQRLEIESKVGRAGLDGEVRGQVARDVEALQANRSLRGAGRVLEGVGKVARPVGIVLDAIQVGSAFSADGNRVGANTGRAVSGIAGGVAGAWGGAQVGAALGTLVMPGVGTAVGAVVFGIAGALGGDAIGRGVFNTVKSWF